MKLSEYINKLEQIKAKYGDLEVETRNTGFDRATAPEPTVAFRKVLKGRESKPDFFNTYDEAFRKGERVVRV